MSYTDTKLYPWFTAADTLNVLRREHSSVNLSYGHPWIDSPIFDALAAERFGR